MDTRTAPLRLPALAAALVLGLAAPLAFAAPADMAGGQAGHAMDQPRAAADIVDTAVAAGQFKTLAAALQAAGLVDTLKGPGPFTVFAPTDAAFAALPPGTVENLLKPENRDQLVSILTYHVVPGRVTASQVATMDAATSVQGGDLRIRASGDGVAINDAKVVSADVMASNGVIHVIDKVLIPGG
jgi:uncharacterized surface protein with fasciclin (FAS1) repeats